MLRRHVGFPPPAGPSKTVSTLRDALRPTLRLFPGDGDAAAVEVDGDTVEVKVAAGDRAVEIDVDLAGPTVTDRRDDALDADDREAVAAAVTTLADGVRIAAAAHRGEGGISEVELQRDSEIAWEIEFTDGGEVAVAVDDGAVLNADG